MAPIDRDRLFESNAGPLIGIAGAFLALSWFSVFLRTYTRAVLVKGLQLDDWLMLVGQTVFTLYAVFLFQGILSGIGSHNDAIPTDDQRVEALKWQSLAIGTYIIDMMFIKLSIGVFLLRIATRNIYKWVLWVSLFIITVWTTVLFIWNLVQCIPIEKQWDYRITWGHCVHPDQIVSMAYALSAMTIMSDWLFALLPIPMLWKVKMSTQAKVTVMLILSMGIFASIATLVRIRFLPDMENTRDILYAGTNAMIWTVVEAGLAIVASSLATIRPLLRAMRIRGFESPSDGIGGGPGPVPGIRPGGGDPPTESTGRKRLVPDRPPSISLDDQTLTNGDNEEGDEEHGMAGSADHPATPKADMPIFGLTRVHVVGSGHGKDGGGSDYFGRPLPEVSSESKVTTSLNSGGDDSTTLGPEHVDTSTRWSLSSIREESSSSKLSH